MGESNLVPTAVQIHGEPRRGRAARCSWKEAAGQHQAGEHALSVPRCHPCPSGQAAHLLAALGASQREMQPQIAPFTLPLGLGANTEDTKRWSLPPPMETWICFWPQPRRVTSGWWCK